MSLFQKTLPLFETFLMSAKDNHALDPRRNGAPGNIRFIPRNFLLEERLDDSRVGSYAAGLPNDGDVDFKKWDTAHDEYLELHVFVDPPAGHDHRLVPPANPKACPETFRSPLALIPFQETDLNTHLIRLVPVSHLASLSGERQDTIFSLGEQVVLDPKTTNPAYRELARIFDNAFNNPDCDHRPVFAAFYEDFRDELRIPVDPSWPDRLRDRLGLYHISQWRRGGLPRGVFLFKYSVRDLPRFHGDPDRRPMATPTVLDNALSESFCPAPRELGSGRMMNLKDNALEMPAREILHLFMPMKVDYLFRVGLVRTPVPDDLMRARRDHLIYMRLELEDLKIERDVYASDTDADLFT